MIIRKGKKEDLQFLPGILMDAYVDIEEYGEESLEKARRYIEDLYEEDPECFFVAEADGKIAGFIFCNRFWYSKFEHSKMGAIHEIVVLPAYRGQGLGKKLIETAMNFMNAENIELWVGIHNQKAVEFYRKLGFMEKEHTEKWIRMVNYRE